MSRKIVQFLMLATLVAVTTVAMADPPARVGRVTVTEGRVTMLVNGEEESGNLMNWPVTSENHLTTAAGARAEFRVGSAAIRLDGDTDLEVQELDEDRVVLRLNYGTAAVRVRDPDMLIGFEFLTPQARITLTEPGSFRVDTERAPDTTVVNVFTGNLRVEGGVVELWVQWVAGDVRDDVGQPFGGGRVQGQPAEGALVDEAEFGGEGVVEANADAQVLLVGCALRLDEQLAAHAEVRENGSGLVGERKPEVLAATLRQPDPVPLQPCPEVLAARDVPAHRARMQHLYVGDDPSADPALQTASYDLDLGKLGHVDPPDG